jgi:hypothetical protein
MRNVVKALVPVIFVLSLGILVQPKPGTCATAVEYGNISFEGFIATVGDGFAHATIDIAISETYQLEDGSQLIIGKGTMNAVRISDGKKFWNDNKFDCTGYLTESSIAVTTTNNAILSGILDLATNQSSLILQIPKDGTTGHFVLSPSVP